MNTSHLNNVGVSMLEKLCIYRGIYLVNLKAIRSKIGFALEKLKVRKTKYI